MVFSSAIFLTLFLPLFLMVYYLTPAARRSYPILIGSYIFYGWWRIDFLLLFVVVTVMSYAVSRIMVSRSDTLFRKTMLWLGVSGNLCILGYFKYFNFGVDAFYALAGMQPESFTLWRVILPVGISFYIFQSISYIVDVYRGDATPAPKFIDFAAFIALFPQLIAGPVLRYKDLESQFRERVHSWEKFNEGALRFAGGFCKKVLVADSLAPMVEYCFNQPNPSFADAWLGALAYTAQLYFDFSGYSSMAIGIGLMMGFRFVENFNHPYISRSITEFWRRWHISLSTWLRDYLYIPLGGNRKGALRTYVNLFMTMLLGGIWHGAGWTFVIWGAWHGALLTMERLLGAKRSAPYPPYCGWLITFMCVVAGWVMFRAATYEQGFAMLSAMFQPTGYSLSDTVSWQITGLQLSVFFIAYGWMFIAPYMLKQHKLDVAHNRWAQHAGAAQQGIIMTLFVIAVAKMIAQSYSPFLYFQF